MLTLKFHSDYGHEPECKRRQVLVWRYHVDSAQEYWYADRPKASQVLTIVTGIAFEVGKPKTVQQGVSTTLVAALDPRIAADSGSYMEDCAVVGAREYATSSDNAKKLWSISEELVGQEFEF